MRSSSASASSPAGRAMNMFSRYQPQWPEISHKCLKKISGHWGWYRENMFMARPAGDEAETEDQRIYALKPMNCPGHIMIFKNGLRSYRELPLRLAEFGLVHRYEP